MKLKDIIGLYPVVNTNGSLEKTITGIEHNSKNIKKDNLFIAQKGSLYDGHNFIKDAIKRGASAIVVEDDIEIMEDITIIKVHNSLDALAYFAGKYYNLPWRQMEFIGITGTNGKTTTSYILRDIFINNKNKVGLIGTIGAVIGDEKLPLLNTTPDSLEIERKLVQMEKANIDYSIMEVSSHALNLRRVRYIDFNIGIFTNLSPEHLDYHKTMENYFNSKSKLFSKTNKFNIINADDSYGDRLTKENLKVPFITYGIEKRAHIRASDIEYYLNKTVFTLNILNKKEKMELNFPGKFNLYNALAAISCSIIYGIDLEIIKSSLKNIKPISGRLEFIENDKNLNVIIDFAHTPNGLEETLKQIKLFAIGRLIVVFGAGGDRDKEKRSIMGELAGRHSDLAIVTSDNPRTEDPLNIINDIIKGIKKTNCNYIEIKDRKKAIEYAINSCDKDDIILLAGKGHEKFIEINGEKLPFDEKEIVLNTIKSL
ncbi:MAG: UDP-N-acetylmuramoyl-L-alanyl-D-glutamate--2,6-diaminopimelate ligase [Tissierella sp.]|uniref:UDP-N-acetylmuramoyl-L-alanyl-D-glutamate--2, 6-diaminopimelate ligase n=1 Tax=Tissierella sp. TaxID=41274 RepID=UPI003F9656A2